MKSDGPSRMKRLLRWMGTRSTLQWGVVLLVGFIALVALLYCEENGRGKWAWERYKREMAVQGKVLDWAAHVPPPVPVDENVFAAPNMSEWFVKRNGSASMPLSLSGMSNFNQDEYGNTMAEITVLAPDSEIASGEADLVLAYHPPLLAFALSGTNAPNVAQTTNQIIPLIVMDEVPLSDAIKNLAKEAKINYTLDPKAEAERNADGSWLLDSKVSLRWTNLTGSVALEAVLANYNLQLVEDPKTLRARIFSKDMKPAVGLDVRERLKKIALAAIETDTNAATGPSLTAALMFTLHKNPVRHGKPVRIIIKAEKVPPTDEIVAFFPGNLRASGANFQSNPRVKSTGSNTFKVWMSPGNHVTAADYLAWSDQFEPEFEIIREGFKRPYARMSGSYEDPNAMPMLNFVTVRVLAHTLSQRAQCYLLQGEPDKALHELTMMHDLCRMLEGRPKNTAVTLVAAMINVAVRGIYVSVVADGLRLQSWREPQLVVLQEQLNDVDLLSCLKGGLETWRVVDCQTLENLTPEEFDRMYKFPSPASATSWQDRFKDPVFLFLTFIPRGWRYQNMINIGKMDGKAIEKIDLTNRLVLAGQTDALFNEWELARSRPSPQTLMAAQIVPSYGRAFHVAARNQTLVNEAQIVCALERYYLLHGCYPETLEALVPQFLQVIPHDIVGGAPLKYRMEKGRFALYSIGWNEKDDGGAVALNKEGNTDLENGDWVWAYRGKLAY